MSTVNLSGGLTIDEERFRQLVRGESIDLEVNVTSSNTGERVTLAIPIILADMGWDRMILALKDAGAFDWPATYDEAVERYRQGYRPPKPGPPV